MKNQFMKRALLHVTFFAVLICVNAGAVTEKTDILIPPKLGVVKESYSASGNRMVIIIQDAHCVYDVQSNIAALLDLCVSKYGISLITVEGAIDSVDTTPYRSFPLKSVRDGVADIFMKKGIISGSEYFSITADNPVTLWGVDDAELYKENLASYMDFLACKQQISALVDSIHAQLAILANHLYPSDYLAFKHKKEVFQKADTQDDLTAYSDFLQKYANEHQIDMSGFGQFNLFLESLESAKTFDFNAVHSEYEVLYSALHEKLPKTQLQEFLKKDFAAKLNRISQLDYYRFVEHVCVENNIALEDYTDLKNYIAYLKIMDQLHPGEVLKEARKIEHAISETMFVTPEQRDCYNFSRAISVLRHFFNLNLSVDDIEFASSATDYFDARKLYAFLKGQTAAYNLAGIYLTDNEAFEKGVKLFGSFYDFAHTRDHALISNVISRMDQFDADTAVLIAGGFHTEGLKQELKDENIGYVVVTPRVNSLPETTSYLELLRGDSSAQTIVDRAAASSLAIASWMSETPIVNRERKRQFGNLMRAHMAGNAVREMVQSDADFFKDGLRAAVDRANDVLREWQVAYAPSIDIREVRKIGSVLFAVVSIDNVPLVYTFYNQLDFNAPLILPDARRPIDAVVDEQIVQEILPYSVYNNIVKNAPRLVDSVAESIPLAFIKLDRTGRYSLSIHSKSRNRILNNTHIMDMIKDIGRNVPNANVERRLSELERHENNEKYLEVLLDYYGNLIADMAELLHDKYEGIDERLWIRLAINGGKLSSVNMDNFSIMVDVNALRSIGLLFAQIEHGFLFNVYEPHVVRALRTLEMTEQEINEYKHAVIEFFVTLKKLERYEQYGFDNELGDKTLRTMLLLAGTHLVDHREIDLIGMNDEERFEQVINLIKDDYPMHSEVISHLERENQYLLKAIDLKLKQSLLGAKADYQFVERALPDVIDIRPTETIDDVAEQIQRNGVDFIEIKFLDPNGKIRSVLAPVGEINDFLENGVGFDGSSIEGFGYIYQSDMVARLDPERFKIYKARPGQPVKASIWAVPMKPEENRARKLKNPINFRKKVDQPQTPQDVLKIMRDKEITTARLTVVDSTGHMQFIQVSLADLEMPDIWQKGIPLPKEATFELATLKPTVDMRAIPDPSTMRLLDWKDGSTPELFMYVDLTDSHGEPFAGDFRSLLKNAVERAENMGFEPIMAPEPEFFLLDRNGELIDNKKYYDDLSGVAPAIRKTLQDIMIAGQNAGMRVRYVHHEVAPGQYEIPMDRGEALVMADNIMFYKEIVRRAAERNGLQSTFRAKVKPDINGSGMHVHQSLRSIRTGENVFSDTSDPMKLSPIAKSYVEGLMTHARGISALTNQFPNSYERLTPGFEAPIAIAWGLRNRSALVRIPGWPDESKGAARIEYRGPDPMGATHLTFAALIHAGLDGVEKQMTPRPAVIGNIYKMDSSERDALGINSLPTSMDEAIDELRSNEFVKSFLPDDALKYLVFRGKKLRELARDTGKIETIEDAARSLESYNVQFIEIKFVNPQGGVHSVLAPKTFAKSLFEDGVGFDGSSIPGYGVISASDMSLRIDPRTMLIYEGQNGAPNYAVVWAKDMNPEDNRPRELKYPVEKFKGRTVLQTREDVIAQMESKGIDSVRFAIPDHLGNLQFQTVTLDVLKEGTVFDDGIEMHDHIAQMLPTLKNKIGFRSRPDISSFRILDLHDGSPLEAVMYVEILDAAGNPFDDYRAMLKQMEDKVRTQLNAEPIMASEPEFFLLRPDGGFVDRNGYYSEIGGMDAAIQKAMQEILLSSQSLGIDVRYVHHEVAPSQYEIPVGASTALEAADNTMLFKWVVTRVAEKYGFVATFVPKVTPDVNGSGMHVHQSLRSLETGENLFADSEGMFGLSQMAQMYVGGILKYVRESTALLNQTKESYNRLIPGFEAPTAVAWGPKNRSAAVRVPGWADPRLARIELRSPDPHGNAHLTFATMLAAGLRGIERGIMPPAPITSESYAKGNIYRMTQEQRDELGILSLPTSLPQAIKWLGDGYFVYEAFGKDFVDFILSRGYYELGERINIGTVQTADEVLRVISENKVEFIEIKFPDPQGKIRGVLAPVGELESFLTDGVGFDGSSIKGFADIYESDKVARLDPSTLTVMAQEHGQPLFASIWAVPMSPDQNEVRVLEDKGKYTLREEVKRAENMQDAIDMLVNAELEYVKFAITDTSGELQLINIPIDALRRDGITTEGIEISEDIMDEFPTLGIKTGMRVIPDPTTLRILDWRDGKTIKHGFMFVDIVDSSGKLFNSPRQLLKNVIAEAEQLGVTPIVAPEPEFFLLNPDGTLPDTNQYYDTPSSLPARVKNTMRDIIRGAESIGMKIRYVHHEVAPGQYEIPMDRKPALEMADDIMIYKYIVTRTALRHGFKAVFNAKVFPDQNGSGMHVHQSLVRMETGKNIFASDTPTESNLSPIALAYAEGILRHSPALMALTNQHPNSFERLVPGFEAPIYPVMGVRNRSSMIRVPGWPAESKGAARIEFRMPDPMGTAHLSFAAMIKAGITGVKEGLTPRDFISDNVYKMSAQQLDAMGIDTLPGNYSQAVEALAGDSVLREFIGEDFMNYLLEKAKDLPDEKLVDLEPIETIDTVAAALKRHNVDFIEIKFLDPENKIRGVLASVSEIKDFLENGVGFDGSSIAGFGFISRSDMVVRIDPERLKIYKAQPGQPVMASIWAIPMKPEENTPRKMETPIDFSIDAPKASSKKDVLDFMGRHNLKSAQLTVVDATGEIKQIEVSLSDLQQDNIWNNGVLLPRDLTGNIPSVSPAVDVRAIPDPATMRVLDWKDGSTPQLFMYVNLVDRAGRPFEADLRRILQNVVDRAEKMDFEPILAPEPEFFLLDANGQPVDKNRYYGDISGVPDAVRRTLQDIMIASQQAGIRVRYAHHEVAPGQYEIPMEHGSAMEMADQIMFYKHIVYQAAKRNGLQATFRAKVKPDINGSGMHVHQSLRRISTGENVFSDEFDDMRISATAKNYIAGLMNRAREISALTNQHPNSYERLTPGYEAPVALAWGLRNRSALVRVPGWPDKSKGAARIEYRAPDPMGTTHLAFAALISAGLDGIEKSMIPVAPVSKNIYKMTSKERDQLGIVSLPTSMDEAIHNLERSGFVRSFLPENVVQFLVARGRHLNDQNIDIEEPKTIDDVAKLITKHQVAFIEVKFVDPNGKVHSVLAPNTFAGSMLEDGLGFDGSSIPGYGGISASDMALRIDPRTLIIYKGQDGAPNFAAIWANDMLPEHNEPRELMYPIEKFQPRSKPESASEVIALLEDKGIKRVKFAIPTHTGDLNFQTISVQDLKEKPIFAEGFVLREAVGKMLPTIENTYGFRAVPDVSSLRILDFYDGSPLEAIMFVDVVDSQGKPFADFRNLLKVMEDQVKAELGAEPIMAPEPEFFFLNTDGSLIDANGYYDEIGGLHTPVQNALREILLASRSLGIDVRYAHHEVAPSQYEIPVGATTALECADNTMLFKWVVSRIARKYGFIASFSPKVLLDENGSGMHVHQSLKDLNTGRNLFADDSGRYGLSSMAESYVAGLLTHIRELTALINQTKESYNRLIPGFEAPVAVAWGEMNRSCSIRVPGWADPKLARVELRSPDPHGNAHMVLAAMLAAGLRGVRENLQPPSPITSDDYAGGNIFHMTQEQRDDLGIVSLPTSLPQALLWLDRGTVARQTFGDGIVDFFLSRGYYELGERIDIGSIQNADDAIKALHENKVEFIEIKFPDPNGNIRGVYAALGDIESFLTEGIGFDGSSIEGFGYIFKSDMVARLDPSTLNIFAQRPGEPMGATIWGVPMLPEENKVRTLEEPGKYSFREVKPKPANRQQALDQLEAEGIENVKLSVTDMSGNLKFVTVPVSALKKDATYKDGIILPTGIMEEFAAVQLPSGIKAIPDPTTLRILDWKDGKTPKEAFMFVQVLMPSGEAFRSDPRNMLKQAVTNANEAGYEPILAPEPEFFLLNPDGSLPEQNSYYDTASTLPANIRQTLRDIIRGAESIGMRIRYAHHEVAPGQYEIPMDRKPALEMADDIMIYKYILQQAAQRHNLQAVLNAKVFPHENGSGMHVHQSLKRLSDGKNAFASEEKTPSNLSKLALQYAEGILTYAPALMALTNQTPNSYERLVPGYEAPVYPVIGVRNRSAMIRIPGWPDESKGAARIEFRMPDPMGTAHLSFAAMIHAGMLGIHQNLTPRRMVSDNVFKMSAEDMARHGIETLPANYTRAIQALADDTVMSAFVGEDMIAFLHRRAREISTRRSFETRLSDFSIRVDENGRIQIVSHIEQNELRNQLRKQGVSIIDSTAGYISPSTAIGKGTIIGANVTITGNNIQIGRNVRILDGARIQNASEYPLIIRDGSIIGEGVVISGSQQHETIVAGSVYGRDVIGFAQSGFDVLPTGKITPVGIDQAITVQRILDESI